MTHAGYEVASAKRGDIPGLTRLIRALADYERLSEICVSTEADLAEALFGPKPSAEALVARISGFNGEIVGFALFFHTFSTFLGRRSLWLEDLFVHPEHRGRGIGRRLLFAVAAIARERRCGRFEWAVLDWNEPALRFYRALVATVMPDWRIARVTGSALEQFGSDGPTPLPTGR